MSVRPKPEGYIPEFRKLKVCEEESSEVIALDTLISIGGYITAYAAPDTAAGFGQINPYFHHDLWRLFSEWRGAGRRVLKRDKDLFVEEIDVLEESGEVHSRPLAQEDPDFGSKYANDLLLSIQRETSKRLETLRIAKKKAENDIVQRISESQPIEFDAETSMLYVRGKPIEIDKKVKQGNPGTFEHKMLAILFAQAGKSMSCQSFWAKWREQEEEDYDGKRKKNWDGVYGGAERINKKARVASESRRVILVVTEEISVSKEFS